MADQKEPTSIPGKLAAWLWQRLPAGRQTPQEPLPQQLDAEQARIAERDQQVRDLLAQIRPPKEFQETLDELNARRLTLAQSENLAELRALRSAYDSWMADVEDLIGTRATQQERAERARQQMNQLRADLPAARALTPSEAAQLARLETRLADLNESEAKLERLWDSAQDRQVWIHQLGTAYRSLEAEALALWRAVCSK